MVPIVSPIFVGNSVTCHIKRTVFNRHLTTNELGPWAGLLFVATPLRVGGRVGGCVAAAAKTEFARNAFVVVVTVAAPAAVVVVVAVAAAAAADASESADE